MRCLALLLLPLAASAAAAEEPMVIAVRFEGNRRYTEEFLRERIATKAGQPLDAGLLARDEAALLEYFAAVTDIEERPAEGGVEVVFHVEDLVVVGKVEVLGLSRVGKDEYEPLMSTRSGRPLLDHALGSDREMLERLHREHGYHFAEVHSYRRRTEKPDVEDVVFQVFSQRRVKVREVILEGAKSVDRVALLRGCKNSDRYRDQLLGLGNPFAVSYFDRAALDEDRRRIETAYQREGFLDARVVLVETRFDEDRRHATIVYRVDEGARYTLRSLEVVFADRPDGPPHEEHREFLAPQALAGLATMRPGDPYRQEDVERAHRAMSERMWSRAYALANIEIVATPDARAHVVDLTYRIASGIRVRVGRLRIAGNNWTKDNVIRRAFREGALPGDWLDPEALEEGRNRLVELRYFNFVRFGEGVTPREGLVKSPNPDRPDEYDVQLEVAEDEKTRHLNFGAGVTTDGGLSAEFTVNWRNFDIAKPPTRPWGILDEDAFRGAGQTFTLSLAPGTTFSTFRVAFTDPAVRDSRWSFHVNVYRSLSLFEDYDQTADGVVVRVGRYLDRGYHWHLSTGWTIQQVLIEDPEPDAPLNALDAQGTTSLHGLELALRYETLKADRFLRGAVTSLGAEVYGGFLGAQVDL
ncbi:MAG: BamA/OMP85 family outer membrane protein, partial [Planctomycetota bacterium]